MESYMSFENDGYVELSNFFTSSEIDKLESVVVKLFLSQAKKIGEHRDLALSLSSDGSLSNKDKFVSLYEAMDINDKEALYQVQKLLPSSQFIRDIFSDRFFRKCSEFINVDDVELMLADGPAIFVNRPNSERLLYKWHSEAHYYPKRRNFLNVWFPIFVDKIKTNGTMSFKVGSHKRDFPFSEYRGYNKDTENKSNYYNQYEIPANLLSDYGEHFCEVNRGGVVFFDRSLVHRSNNNPTSDYSFAVVARVWEHSNDLTISGLMSATPFGGDVGRSDLHVSDVL
jgi:hypothetical protein